MDEAERRTASLPDNGDLRSNGSAERLAQQPSGSMSASRARTPPALNAGAEDEETRAGAADEERSVELDRGGHVDAHVGVCPSQKSLRHQQSTTLHDCLEEDEWGLPANLPALHKAVWEAARATRGQADALLRNLERACDELAGGWALTESKLVWCNPDVYTHGGRKESVRAPPWLPAKSARLEPALLGQSSAGLAVAPAQAPPAPTDAPPIDPGEVGEATAPEADEAMRALLRRSYLWHACHPLTIAAAYGNVKVLRLLIRKMKGDAESKNTQLRPATWIKRPKSLPPKEVCPWVTPLAAAALGGNPWCVEEIAMEIPEALRYKDGSSFGCFSFGPIAVAQTEGAVTNLFKLKCCDKDAVNDLAQAALRIRNHEQSGSLGDVADVWAKDEEKDAQEAAAWDKDEDEEARVKVAARPRTAKGAAKERRAAAALGNESTPDNGAPTRRELFKELLAAQLFRSRLGLDMRGRPLEDAVLELDHPARVSLNALTGLLDNDLNGNLLHKGLPQQLVKRYQEADTAAESTANDTPRSQKLKPSEEKKETLLRLLTALLEELAEPPKATEPQVQMEGAKVDTWLAELVDDAWANGPQELALLLLQVSADVPNAMAIAEAPMPPQREGTGFSSLLLAFGAKLQDALVKGRLPAWLERASDDRFVHLMEDLIRCSMVNDPEGFVGDAEWLIMGVLEPCMAHEYKALRLKAAKPEAAEVASSSGSLRASDAPEQGRFTASWRSNSKVYPEQPPPGAANGGGNSGMNHPAWARVDGDKPLSSDGNASAKQKLQVTIHPDEVAGPGPGARASAAGGSMASRGRHASAAGSAAPAPESSKERLEDGAILHVARNLVRETADALLDLHAAYQGNYLEKHLARLPLRPAAKEEWQPAAVGAQDAGAGDVGDNVPWGRALSLAARIVRHTLDPPQEFGNKAKSISYFVVTKAVTQLLYIHDAARSVTDEEPDDSEKQADSSTTLRHEDTIDISLLEVIARRHPHEAARLLHTLDPEPIEESEVKVPMDLPHDFYTVFTRGEPLRDDEGAAAAAPPNAESSASRNFTLWERFFGADVWDGLVSADAPQDWDVTQACVWQSLWRPLTHFILSSTRATLTEDDDKAQPGAAADAQGSGGAAAGSVKGGSAAAKADDTQPKKLKALSFLRRRSYALVLLGQLCQVGSIPVVVAWLAILFTAGLVHRIALRVIKGAGTWLREPIKKRLGAGSGRHRHKWLQVLMRFLNKILSFIIALVDRNEANRAWLGITRKSVQREGREHGDGIEGATDGSTHVLVNRVPIKGAAAMPATLLYQLASSSQVNAEVFASPTMRAIIMWRWQHFARYYLLMQFLEHLIFMMFFILYAFSLSYGQDAFADLLGSERTGVGAREDCAGMPVSPFQQFLLVCIGVLTVTCVMQEVQQLIFFGWTWNWLRQPWNVLDAASIGLVTAILALHSSCAASEELLRGLAAVEVALLFIRLLYFAMTDDHMGSFFRMVIVVLRDLSLFFVFLGVLYVGWGLALTVLQGHEASMVDIYIQLFTSIFGDFGFATFEMTFTGDPNLDRLYRIFISLYQILVTIILLNLLIAIINDSFERVKDANEYESLRNRLTLIVEVESLLPGALVRFMLRSLARADLYIVQPQTATIGNTDDAGGDGGKARRELLPPSGWNGRTGETKRFMVTELRRMAEQHKSELEKLGKQIDDLKAVVDDPAKQQVELNNRIDRLFEELKAAIGKGGLPRPTSRTRRQRHS